MKWKSDRKIIAPKELDVLIPSLNLAFELNGIFHYEPIYGSDKLSSIKNNDERKFQACLEKGIELVIIDTSSQVYFKEKTSQKYFDIIENIIDIKYGRNDRTWTDKLLRGHFWGVCVCHFTTFPLTISSYSYFFLALVDFLVLETFIAFFYLHSL